MSDIFEPKIIAFLCNWCSYAGADLAGVSRVKYPDNVRIIRVMCSSRVNPIHVLRCFQRGADGVLIAGCHPGECHYQHGNYYTRRRFILMRRLLEYFGINPDRLKLAWVSASEGTKFADVIHKITEDIRAIGPMNKLRKDVV